VEINIRNCNNIEAAHIIVEESKLNIKYAMNGTGKSTIATAVDLLKTGKDLKILQSFGEEIVPSVTIDDRIHKVLVFNESFVNNVVFKESNVIQNAFEVFIKTPKYEELQASIDRQLESIHLSLSGNDDLNSLYSIGSNISNKVSFTTKGELKQTGLIKNVLSSKSIFKLPESITKFQPLMDKDYNVSWVAWKDEGGKYDDTGICPFCTNQLDEKYPEEKKIFAESYKKSNVAGIKELLSYFENVQEYIEITQYEQLTIYIKECNDEATMQTLLTQFWVDLNYLIGKIRSVIEFDSYKIRREELSDLSTHLQSLIIEKNILKVFTSEKTLSIIDIVNSKINNIIDKTEELKKEMGALKGFILSRTQKVCEDINNFLDMAVINYRFELKIETTADAKTILKYINKNSAEVSVDNIRLHLSWGERNAFALILFMHHALSQNADLIILDDPISSFDSNKKYAIINRLFENNPKSESFYGKTVVMLTHDFQPVIDFIVNNKPNGGNTVASFMSNKNRIVDEIAITKDDIKSLPILLADSASNDTLNIIHRIACLRKLIEQTQTAEVPMKAYNLLSCLLHGKQCATYMNETPMSQEHIELGESYISDYISDFSFNSYLTLYFQKDYLLTLYKTEPNNYYKLQIFRILLGMLNLRTQIDDVLLKYIDEQFHIENDYMFYLDLNVYDIMPDYIIPKCDEYLQNKGVI
jgi:energy-coupling factor transporter ATP-binding protein EcfA2